MLFAAQYAIIRYVYSGNSKWKVFKTLSDYQALNVLNKACGTGDFKIVPTFVYRFFVNYAFVVKFEGN